MVGMPWTGDDLGHNRSCGARWNASLNRSTADLDYPEEWYAAQCGGCRFWVALAGDLGRDFGACTHEGSAFDGRVRFEHDGCAVFAVREDGSFG